MFQNQRSRKLLCWLGCALWLCACMPTTAGADDLAGRLTISLKLNRSSIFPFEPLVVWVTVANASKESQIDPSKGLCCVLVRADDKSVFEARGLNESACVALPPTKTLSPGQTRTTPVVLEMLIRAKHVFARPGVYWIKAHADGIGDTEALKLVVAAVPREEVEPTDFLAAHDICHSFTAGTINEYIRIMQDFSGKNPAEEMNDFVHRFPKSRYADWCRYGSALVRRIQSAEKDDALLAMQREFENIAPQVIEPVATNCWLEAGTIAIQRGEVEKAEIDFTKAAGARGSDTVTEQIAYIRATEVRTAATQATVPNLNPDQIILRVTHELESQRYDVRAFLTEESDGLVEYMKAVDGVIKKQQMEHTSIVQLNYSLGEQLRRCVMVYCKPLTPEGWAARQAKYDSTDNRNGKMPATLPDSGN